MNPEWEQYYIQAGQCQQRCQELDELDAKLKDLQKLNESRQINECENLKIQIAFISKQFIEWMSTAVQMINQFFSKQMLRIQKEKEEAILLANRAIKIQLSQNKCISVQQKMRECMRNAVQLQNYVAYNNEQLRKIAVLHDSTSDYTLKAELWVNDIIEKTEIDVSQQFEQFFDSLALSFSEMMNISQKKALTILRTQKINQETDSDKQKYVKFSAFILGMCIIVIINQISFVAFWFKKYPELEITKIQQAAISYNYIIGSMLLGFGCVLYYFIKFRLNYIFILQIPGSIIQYGYSNVIKLGAIQLLVVSICSLLCTINQLNELEQFNQPLPIIFGQFAINISKLMKPTYWLLFPTLLLPVYTIINMIKFRGQRSVYSYSMIVLFRIFTPWRQRIEFPHFFFCNFMNSAKYSFRDIILVIGCNKIPDYILIIFENIFSINRCIQLNNCFSKYAVEDQLS
ncbi:EXS_family protein [Hexamita inflata]|uniref:EXS family protein n=1 Tax=Hexamita inflata TaxID=28002 RepID=A0AA86QUY2_9EUKA|nr:EXS family protein [Hexamita inflata]